MFESCSNMMRVFILIMNRGRFVQFSVKWIQYKSSDYFKETMIYSYRIDNTIKKKAKSTSVSLKERRRKRKEENLLIKIRLYEEM